MGGPVCILPLVLLAWAAPWQGCVDVVFDSTVAPWGCWSYMQRWGVDVHGLRRGWQDLATDWGCAPLQDVSDLLRTGRLTEMLFLYTKQSVPFFRAATRRDMVLLMLTTSRREQATPFSPAGDATRLHQPVQVKAMGLLPWKWSVPLRCGLAGRTVGPQVSAPGTSPTPQCLASALLGPAVLLHYLHCRDAPRENPLPCTVDTGLFVQRHMHGAALRALWRTGRPGSAVQLLQQWTGLPSRKVSTLDPGWLMLAAAPSMIAKYLVTRGPALVSSLAMHAAVLDASITSHIGPSVQRSLGATTGVLLAWRREQGVHLRFLLQTWWPDKPFIEVDAAYLASRGAHVSWFLMDAKDFAALPPAVSLICARTAHSHACGFDIDL